jgi:hypothetical protein
MADKSKSRSSGKDKQSAQSAQSARSGESAPGSLSAEKAGTSDVKSREHASRPSVARQKHPAGADVEQQKTRAQQRDEHAAERRAQQRTVSNPDLETPQRDKALEAVREHNEELREHWRYHGRTEVQHEILGVPDPDSKDDDGGVVLLSSAGGRVYVSCSRPEIVLDHDGAADLQRAAQQLFQAAS